MKFQVSEWYRAQLYQVCPRARYWNFHHNGNGIEAVELSPSQAAAHVIREAIGKILAGTSSGKQAALDAGKAFTAMIGTRGVRTSEKSDAYVVFKDYRARVQDCVDGYADRFSRPPSILAGYSVVRAGEEISFTLANRIVFVAKPVAILKHPMTKEVALYYVKAAARVSKDTEKLVRDFRLLSELAALNSIGFKAGKVIVQQIGMSPVHIPEAVELDPNRRWVVDWEIDITKAEQYLEYRETSCQTPEFFPQHRHSCSAPYPCAFAPICWEGADPDHDVRYMPRLVQLEKEKELAAKLSGK